MTRVFIALRAAVYAASFLGIWGWLALQLRAIDDSVGWALPQASRQLGLVLFVMGAALAAWCLALFIEVGRGTAAPFDPPRRLIPVGPYRWVRNPMYLGGLLMLCGFGLWHRSVAMVAFVLPAGVVAHMFVVLYEERTLEERFGSSYKRYKGMVRRWLPKLPRDGLGRSPGTNDPD